MKIEVVANKLSETDPETGMHYSLAKGDTLTVPEDFGKHLCDRGWAKDTARKYKSAPFTPGAAKLDVPKATLTPKKRGG